MIGATAVRPGDQPAYLTNFRRILEKFCEFFEMAGYPKSSPNFSDVGVKMPL